MRVLRVNIEQQMAQIDIHIQQARLHMEMPDRRMEIVSRRPEMKAYQEKPDVELDMDEFKANIGLKTYDQLTAEAATGSARVKALQGDQRGRQPGEVYR